MSIYIYLYAIIACIFMFILLELDKRFIVNKSYDQETDYFSSLRIASLVGLIVWGICAYQENNFIETVPSLKVQCQKILTDNF